MINLKGEELQAMQTQMVREFALELRDKALELGVSPQEAAEILEEIINEDIWEDEC